MFKFILVAAVSLDGKIAKHSKHFSDWTSKEDKVFLRKLLDRADLIIIGRKTYELAKQRLAKRKCLVFTRHLRGIRHASPNLTFFNPESCSLSNYLANLSLKKVIILGGREVYTYFLENLWLDEIYLTIEPIIFGQGLDIFKASKSLESRFVLKSVEKLNSIGSLLLHYVKVCD